MSDIMFEISKTVSIGDVNVTYAVRRVFSSSHYDEVMNNCHSQENVDKFHKFVNDEMESQLERITNKENI